MSFLPMLLAAAPSILNALPGVVSGIKNAFDPPKSATFSMKDQPPGPTPPRSSIDDYNESHGVRPGPSTSVSPWNNPPTNFSSNPPPAGVHPFLGVINQGLHSAQQIAGPGDDRSRGLVVDLRFGGSKRLYFSAGADGAATHV